MIIYIYIYIYIYMIFTVKVAHIMSTVKIEKVTKFMVQMLG